MEERILLPVQASLNNPDDPSEVTLVADVSSVGVTKPIRSIGKKVNWTADLLRAKAHTLVGKPVNVSISDDRATGHSTNVVGTIIGAQFDDSTQKLRVVASLWKHYFPHTIEKLLELSKNNELQTSVEFAIASREDYDEETWTPLDGFFYGLAIVDQGADTGNRVLVLASALKSDMEAMSKLENETPVTTLEPTDDSEVLPDSFEWAGNQIAEYLSSNDITATVTGTYPNEFYYTTDNGSNYKVEMTYTGDGLTFGEPLVWQNNGTTSTGNFWTVKLPEEDEVTNMEELAEVQASLDRVQAEAEDWKNKYETLLAEVDGERAERAAEKQAKDRIEEIEKIAPYEDEALKTAHFELFKSADDNAFNAIKTLIAATVEPKGGIANEGGVPPADDEDKDPVQVEAEANLDKWREELLAIHGSKE